jgi:hypothetical protein
MKLVSGLVLFALAVASGAAAGVEVWAPSPDGFGRAEAIGPDGALYTGECNVFGVCKSTDHGRTWQSIPAPDFPITSCGSGCIFSVLAVDASGAIYVGFFGGGGGNVTATLYVTRDGGVTWTTSRGPDFSVNALRLSIDPFSGALLLLGGFSGNGVPNSLLYEAFLARSADGGASWSSASFTGLRGYGSVTAFVLDSRTPGRVYATFAGVSFPYFTAATSDVYVSSDGGATFALGATVAGGVQTLLVDPFHPGTVYAGGSAGIFRSDDGGNSFVPQTSTAAVQIVADPLHAGRLFAAAGNKGVLWTTDGGVTWLPLNDGLPNTYSVRLTLDAADGYLYSWTYRLQLPDPGALLLDAAHPFTVTLTATNPHSGETAVGVPTHVNDLWGYFSIPAITSNPNNPEVFVKLLDGTAINGKYWFFYGGLTDLEYTLTVTDSTTGATRTYPKPAGSECGGSDTAAFGP